MISRKVKIINPLGLHARAAASLVRLAGSYKSEITLKRADNSSAADAKSILSVLGLAASKGVELDVEFEGSDAEEAAKAIEEIFSRGFGEI